MSEIVLVAEVEFKQGRGDEGARLLEGLGAETRAEPGCVLYALHRVADDPDRAVCIEKWRAEEDFEGHVQSEHAKSLIAFDGLAGAPKVTFLIPVRSDDGGSSI